MNRFDHAGPPGARPTFHDPDGARVTEDDFLAGEQSRLELALAAQEQAAAHVQGEQPSGVLTALWSLVLLAALVAEAALLHGPLVGIVTGGIAPPTGLLRGAVYLALLFALAGLASLGRLSLCGFAGPDEAQLLVRAAGRLAAIALIALFLAWVGRYELFPGAFGLGSAPSWGVRGSDILQSLLAILILPLCLADFSEGMGAQVGGLLRRYGLRQRRAELRQRRDAVLQARRRLRAGPALLPAATDNDPSERRVEASRSTENLHV